MRTVLIIAALLVSCIEVQAQTGKVTYYADQKGNVMSMKDALKQSADDQVIFRCQAVKATMNKAGSGFNFKLVKDPKPAETGDLVLPEFKGQ